MFVCGRCGAELTVAVERVALPVHAHQRYGCDLMPVLMESGTYAVDPEPSGWPWRPWAEVTADEAAARGLFAPVPVLSFGPAGAVVVAPSDTRGTVVIPERRGGFCCGLDGRDGPNLACEGCGQAVATLLDDHARWRAVWLDPEAVSRIPDVAPSRPPDTWDTLLRDRPGTPPRDGLGWWEPEWYAAVGFALAHLLAMSGGVPVGVPDGLVAQTFRRALRVLLPAGPPRLTLALAGPGLPEEPGAGLLLVPQHPQTAGTWRPEAPPKAPEPDVVPIPFDVWRHMAFPAGKAPMPVSGRLPDGVLRDDYPSLPPPTQFRPDERLFFATLARLPEVRTPWLRAFYDRHHERPYAVGF
ncbi:hypothetical protein [Yinghuangia seranimata]|uniref:hypothetical protein n=1 Tax=Yinghuangia seranimata TaxID=408067 RepID=UPI0031B9C7B9